MSKPGIEPVGHLQSGPAEGEPVTPTCSWDDWRERAMAEYELSRQVVPVLNATDEELEALVRESDNLEYWTELLENALGTAGRYEAGADVMNSTVSRLFVVLEHVVGYD